MAILKTKEIIIILIALIIVVIYLIIYFDFLHHLTSENYIDKKFFIDSLKTGDLLFFSGNTFGHRSIKFITNSYFSHVAIVFVGDKDDDKGKVFLIEADIGGNYKSGTRIVPIDEKLVVEKPLLKRKAVLKINKPVGILRFSGKISNEKLLQLFDKYQPLEMDKSMICWISPWFKDKNKIFCSELIAQILQDLDILDIKNPPSYYSPQKLINVLEGKYYSKLEIYNIWKKN